MNNSLRRLGVWLICAALLPGPCAFAAQDQEQQDSSSLPAGFDSEKKITIHFPDTDIRVALETMAAKAGVSIIAGPEVKGRVSIKLENVPWEKGLDILLKTYGYAYVWEEGVVRVMSREVLSKMEMQTQVYKVEFAEPVEVEKAVLVILSKEGAVKASADTRTVIVKETPENQKNIRALIEGLDRLSKEKKERKVAEEPPKPAAKTTDKSLVLNFIDTPIRDAIAQISELSGVYISVGEEVQSRVTLSTGGKEIPWQKALQQVIESTDLAYEPADLSLDTLQAGDFITLRTKDKLLEQYEKDEKISERVDVVHQVIFLKYLDAEDVKKILETQLTARGKITILEVTGQTGWVFNRATATKLAIPERAKEKKPSKSRVILISDIPSSVEKMLKIIGVIDVMPFQIIIEAKIIEVDRDTLRDIGLEFASGQNGLDSTTPTDVVLHKNLDGSTVLNTAFQNLGFNASVTPKAYTPVGSGITPVNSGLKFEISRVLQTQFDMLLHALEEDVGANIISAPKIMTLNNQEAVIVVGTQFPIVTTEITTGTTSTTSVKLDYYQDIGVRLNVVPQVSDQKYINMILHPAVTSQSNTLTIFNTGGFQIAQYPILTTREAETQVLMRDGETIVLGGLLQDNKTESNIGIPFLSAVPFIGPAFTRRTTDTEKKDLLIFITAKIIKKTAAEAGYMPADYFGQPAGAGLQSVTLPVDRPGEIAVVK